MQSLRACSSWLVVRGSWLFVRLHRPSLCYQLLTSNFQLQSPSDCTVWALPRSLATTCGITFVFSSCGYLDVSVPRVSLHYTMDSCNDTLVFTQGGFPHSDIHGSMAICAYPWLFAACRVLLRLLVPRHSPYALNSLTF